MNAHESLPRPEVRLIDFTGNGTPDPARHAANLLVFTKQTRLNMTPGLVDEVNNWPWDRVRQELEYMANTIPSSYEFVNYTFLINNVTRAFTHQFVRTRTGSYAQQTMRVLDVGGWTYAAGPSVMNDSHRAQHYATHMRNTANVYDELIEHGAEIEDARGVLPTNIHTNIVASFNLRTLSEVARKRASSRTQAEYREVLDGMLSEVARVHPWVHLFFDRTFDAAAADLQVLIDESTASPQDKIDMLKRLDLIRSVA